MEIFILKPPVVGKLSMFSGIKNDALMHREGLKGTVFKQQNLTYKDGPHSLCVRI